MVLSSVSFDITRSEAWDGMRVIQAIRFFMIAAR
jgi:hypothetical protein